MKHIRAMIIFKPYLNKKSFFTVKRVKEDWTNQNKNSKYLMESFDYHNFDFEQFLTQALSSIKSVKSSLCQVQIVHCLFFFKKTFEFFCIVNYLIYRDYLSVYLSKPEMPFSSQPRIEPNLSIS